MQIVVKAAEGTGKEAIEEIITRDVAETLGARDDKPLISKVFPDQTSGNRGRLYVVHLPDDLTAREVSRVVERLSSQEVLEYAEIPAAKRPSGASR